MVSQLLSREQVSERTISAVGLSPGQYRLMDAAVLAELVRRSASFESPCSARTLRERVVRGLAGLASEQDLPEAVETMIETLIVAGDLSELPAREEGVLGTHLYLAQPSFVRRSSNRLFLIGIASDGAALLPAALARRIQVREHVRYIDAEVGEDLVTLLASNGLQELPKALWLKRPRKETAQELLQRYGFTLSETGSPGTVDGLQVLDPTRSVRYYKGRWTQPSNLSGRFVGRREQRYGAPIWCYVELERGTLTHLYDIAPDEWRPFDYASYLQLAIDATRGSPQEFTMRPAEEGGSVLVSFFSPLPRWVQMRWEYLGLIAKMKGALFSYILPTSEYEEERKILIEDCWLRQAQIS